jgi:hypothetical protein
MTILFSDAFECPPNTVPSTFTAWSGVTGAPTMQSIVKYSGTYAMKCAAEAYVTATLGSAQNTVYLRFYVNFASDLATTGSLNLVYLFDGGWTNYGNLQYNFEYSSWVIYDNVGGYYSVWSPVTADQWYCVEVQRTTGVGTGVLNLWVDGVNKITQTGISVTGGAQNILLGEEYSSVVSPVYFDNVVIADSYNGIFGIQKYCLIEMMGY